MPIRSSRSRAISTRASRWAPIARPDQLAVGFALAPRRQRRRGQRSFDRLGLAHLLGDDFYQRILF
jgi:hypothetical protein